MHLTRKPGLVILTHNASASSFLYSIIVLIAILAIACFAEKLYILGTITSVLVLVPNPHKSEKVTAVQNMGIQIERKGSLRYFSSQTLFIPAHEILDVLINEVFVGFEVVHVLQIIIKDADRLTLVFQDRLDLQDLETAYRALQKVV